MEPLTCGAAATPRDRLRGQDREGCRSIAQPSPSRPYGLCDCRQVHEPDRSLTRKLTTQERECDVIDWDSGERATFRGSMVCMTVENCGHFVAVQRLFQPAGTEKGENLGRFALYRLSDWRIEIGRAHV